MASGASTEPPPLPPPDYTPIPTSEWAKKRMPPLKGVIVDPEYPPTAEEALLAIKNHERNYEAQWQGQPQPPKPSPSSNSDSQSPTSSTSQEEEQVNPYRSSGTSQIFGRVAGQGESSQAAATTTTMAIPQKPLKRPEDAGVLDVLATIHLSDLKSIPSIPCARESILYSAISGFLVAGFLWTIGKKRSTIVNGGLGTTFAGYFTIFPYLSHQRRLEKKNVTLVKETWEETKAEKKRAWEAYKAKKKEDDEQAKGLASTINSKTASSIGSRKVWAKLWSSGSPSQPGREG